MKHNAGVNLDSTVGAREISDEQDTEGPLPLRALLTRPVVVSVANYGMIALLEMATGTLLPLVWSTSVEFGGLGMSPASIGLWMGGCGFVSCVFLLAAFPPLVRRFGPRLIFITGVILYFPVYSLFPVENLALRHSSGALNQAAVLLIILQLSAISVSVIGFGKFCPQPFIVPGH